MAELSLRNLVKVYDRDFAVRGINLDVPDRCLTVLVGPSGCGKSTTLRMIAGLETISHGELLLDGKVVNDVPSRDRGVAMVFQSYALYPHMTVRQNLAFSLKLQKMTTSEIQKRIELAAEVLELQDYMQRKPAQLSGGQRQRVAMGRALVREPAVFLFDEPLSNLDAKLRNQMRAEIKRLQKKLQVTTVYVTHDQVEAMTLADQIVVMRSGVIEQTGTPIDVFERPANQFVAGFIGSPQMNFLPGITAIVDGQLVLRCHDLSFPVMQDRFTLKYEAGVHLVAGFRPEDIVPDGHGISPARSVNVSAKVNYTEMLGNETLLFLSLTFGELVCRMQQPRMLDTDEIIHSRFNLDKMHIFDAVSGSSLSKAFAHNT